MHGKRWLVLFSVTVFLGLEAGGAVEAQDRPFVSASNTGITGLMEIPTARILEDGRMRIGASNVDPFRTYYFGLGFLPGLEINGRVTEVLNMPITDPGWEGYGNTKIREFDAKYQILAESRLLPAIAVGANDLFGDNVTFSTQYLVMSRQIYPLDFTLGYGFGRIKGPFGGLELKLWEDRLSLVAEYNPIDYTKDRLSGGVKNQPDFPKVGFYSPSLWRFDPKRLNLGMRFRPVSWLSVEASFQRGDTFGLSVSTDFTLGKRLLPPKPDEPYTSPVDRRPLGQRDPREVENRLDQALREQGFAHVAVSVRENQVRIQYENPRFLSEAQAMGRVMRTAAALAPLDVPKIQVVALRRSVPMVKIDFQAMDFMGFLAGKYNKEEFRRMVEIKKAGPNDRVLPSSNSSSSTLERMGLNPEILDYGVKPALETWLDDPSGFFRARAGVDAWGAASLWEGSDFYAWFNYPFYNNIKSAIAPLGENPVRSDMVLYKKRSDPRFNSLLWDQVWNLGGGSFGRMTAGYLETQYAGLSGEFLHVLGDGRWSVGMMGDWVVKRDPESQLGLMDFHAYTLLGSLNYLQPDLGLAAKLRVGRFLAGDPGARLEVARHWDTGASFGFWYTYTDTSGFSDPFNKGYQDKGIFISIPMAMFTREETPVKHSYAFSPWTRDVGQSVARFNMLYEFLEDLLPTHMAEHLEDMKK